MYLLRGSIGPVQPQTGAEGCVVEVNDLNQIW